MKKKQRELNVEKKTERETKTETDRQTDRERERERERDGDLAHLNEAYRPNSGSSNHKRKNTHVDGTNKTLFSIINNCMLMFFVVFFSYNNMILCYI